MSTNRVSASLSPADQKAVLDAIATIKQKLPFLIDLSPEERRALPKLGDKSRIFVSKAAEIAVQNPDFLPRSFDVDEMRRDVTLLEALQPITLALTQLQELVDDTQLEVGSEAYMAWRHWPSITMPAPADRARRWMCWPTSLAAVLRTRLPLRRPPPPPPRPKSKRRAPRASF